MDENQNNRFRISSVDMLIGIYFDEITGFFEGVLENSISIQRLIVGSMIMALLVASGMYVYWSIKLEQAKEQAAKIESVIPTRRRYEGE